MSRLLCGWKPHNDNSSGGLVRGIELAGRVNDMQRRPRGRTVRVGDVFGSLTVQFVTSRLSGQQQRPYCRCVCVCGAERDVFGHVLTDGRVTSCHKCAQQRRIEARGYTQDPEAARIQIVMTAAELAAVADAARRSGESARAWIRRLVVREAMEGVAG